MCGCTPEFSRVTVIQETEGQGRREAFQTETLGEPAYVSDTLASQLHKAMLARNWQTRGHLFVSH